MDNMKSRGWAEVRFPNKQESKRLTEEVLKPIEKTIKDSGARRDFGTGAVRDVSEGKGRFDSCPMDVIADLLIRFEENVTEESNPHTVFHRLNNFMETGDEKYLFGVLLNLSGLWLKENPNLSANNTKVYLNYNTVIYDMIFDFAKHTEAGCLKYGDTIKDENDPNFGKVSPNMMKGIPISCYIDSGTRHYLKHLSGMDDEYHDRAAVWNFIMAIWTLRHHPKLNNIHYEVYRGTKEENKFNPYSLTI